MFVSPPEQRSWNISCASDTWSMGCIVYELLNGTALFAGGTDDNMAELIVPRRGFPSAAQDLRTLASAAPSSGPAAALARAAGKVAGVAAPPWPDAVGAFATFLEAALAMSPSQRSSPT